jgi:hypothetical protein
VAFTYEEHVALARLAMGDEISERDNDIVLLLFRTHLVKICREEQLRRASGSTDRLRTFAINDSGREVARCGRQSIMSAWVETHCSGEIRERARRAAQEAARALDREEAKAHARRVETGPRSAPAGWVYAYGYPRDVVLAEADPAQSRIKVGCTTRSPAERMREQVTTSSPEAPILLGQWPTPPGMSAAAYEAKVHAILDRHGLRLRSGGGTEWFTATLDQVDAAARYAAAFV